MEQVSEKDDALLWALTLLWFLSGSFGEGGGSRPSRREDCRTVFLGGCWWCVWVAGP